MMDPEEIVKRMHEQEQAKLQKAAMMNIGQSVGSSLYPPGYNPNTTIFPSPVFPLKQVGVTCLRFAVRTVVNGYIIEYAETEGQLMQEIVCKTLEEVSAEVVRIVAANKLAGK